MIIRTEKECLQVASLLLNALENEPALSKPVNKELRAGIRQAWKGICARHSNYDDINVQLATSTVQARAIAVIAVDWLHGETVEWERFLNNLITQAKRHENIH